MTFEKLHQIVEITLAFETLGTLSIGAGDQPGSTVDSPIVRIGGEPAIPGSSLKGALRAAVESLLAAKDAQVCVPFTAIPQEMRREKRVSEYLRRIGRLDTCDPRNAVCGACELFGTAGGQVGLSGRAIVVDARLKDGFDPAMLTERTHVAITRDTRSQAGGALMNIEAVDAGVEFTGAIRLINPEDWHVGAVLRGLEAVEQLGLGAKKTSGYGQLKITADKITVKRPGDNDWDGKPGNADHYRKQFDEKKQWPQPPKRD